jgi:hypothetical protein
MDLRAKAVTVAIKKKTKITPECPAEKDMGVGPRS